MSGAKQKANAALESSVERARLALRTHNDYLRGNETATRALVIDVVLGGLGWDIRDPEHVRLEHRVNGKNKVDYVLMSAGAVIAVVEAKAADAGTKGKDVRDASGYADEVGARYAVLTNGSRWEAWAMASTPRRDNIVVEVNLTTGDISEIAEKLAKLAMGELGRRDVVVAV